LIASISVLVVYLNLDNNATASSVEVAKFTMRPLLLSTMKAARLWLVYFDQSPTMARRRR